LNIVYLLSKCAGLGMRRGGVVRGYMHLMHMHVKHNVHVMSFIFFARCATRRVWLHVRRNGRPMARRSSRNGESTEATPKSRLQRCSTYLIRLLGAWRVAVAHTSSTPLRHSPKLMDARPRI